MSGDHPIRIVSVECEQCDEYEARIKELEEEVNLWKGKHAISSALDRHHENQLKKARENDWEIGISINSGDLDAEQFLDKIVDLAESLGITIGAKAVNSTPPTGDK